MRRGNYPYPSSYILNGNGILPAYPVRVACESLRQEDLAGSDLLSAFADALGVFYNYTEVSIKPKLDAHCHLQACLCLVLFAAHILGPSEFPGIIIVVPFC